MNLSLLDTIKNNCKTSFQTRIITEIEYALELNKIYNNKFSDTIEQAFFVLENAYLKTGFISDKICYKAENILMPLSEYAKKQTVLCIAHAHIDINWMWGIDETVSIITSTIKTMLFLLKKYPEFTYAQSQAFVYEIIEKYRPDLLKEIKKFVKEGRFEVTASTYVEADKNLSNGESQIQQIIETKQYLTKLLDIDNDYLNIDFEPDTFGHTEQVPEILSSCGVKYYYHCRGNNEEPMYYWQSCSGKKVLVYREPMWYLGPIEYNSFNYVPDFSRRYGINKLLKVYGVGDHGGGSSIRDIERIIEISKYPIMATIKFGTFHEFFESIEKEKENIKIIQGNQSKIFTGCYTSMSEIKLGNYQSQKSFYNLGVLSLLSKTNFDRNLIKDAIHKMLINQFHDILPGSGTEESKVFALGEYQHVNASFSSYQTIMLERLEKNIDSAKFLKTEYIESSNTSIGAGGGFNTKDGVFTNSFTHGNTRGYLLTNLNKVEFQDVLEVPLWDYYGDINNIEILDANENKLDFVIESKETNFYWYHNYHKIYVNVRIPAFGYTSIKIQQKIKELKNVTYPPLFQRTEDEIADIVLENEYIKAIFDKQNFKLKSICNKETKKELVKNCGEFVLCYEDTYLYMTSWYQGRFKNFKSLHENTTLIKNSIINNNLFSSFSFKTKINDSLFKITISLSKNKKHLSFYVDTDFYEKGSEDGGVPNLRFIITPTETNETSFGDTPMGISQFSAKEQDVPCQNFLANKNLMIVSKAKHGFRFNGEVLSLTLLHASYDPHPYPEYGKRIIEFALSTTDGNVAENYNYALSIYNKPLIMNLSSHKGKLAIEDSLITASKNIAVSHMEFKNNELLIRVFNISNENTEGNIKLKEFNKVGETNSLSTISLYDISFNNSEYTFDLKPKELKTLIFKIK